MALLKRLPAAAAILLGLLGIAASLAGAIAARNVAKRAAALHQQVFTHVDALLGRTSDSIGAARQRAAAVEVSGREFVSQLQSWGARLAAERLAVQRELQPRTEQLIGQIRLAQSWVEMSQHGVLASRQLLQLSEVADDSRTSALLESSESSLERLDDALSQMLHAAERISTLAADQRDRIDEQRMEIVRRLVLSALLAIADADNRLKELDQRLSGIRGSARDLEARIEWKIRLVFYGCLGLLAWIALGQAALVRLGWRGMKISC